MDFVSGYVSPVFWLHIYSASEAEFPKGLQMTFMGLSVQHLASLPTALCYANGTLWAIMMINARCKLC